MTEWKKEASNFLKSEMSRRGLGYSDLVKSLKEIGIDETYNSVAMKINKGAFSFFFFLQCMKALGVKSVNFNWD